MVEQKRKPVVEVLAENVIKILEKNKESGSTVSGRRGPTTKTINNIVNRRHKPTLKSIEKLARALGIEPYQLLCPIQDGDFLTIIRAYNETDDRGRETLVDNAQILLDKKKRGRPETGEAID